MPMPTKRTPKVVEDILARLSTGETLAAILRSEERFPSATAWLEWCAADESLSLAYARARDAGESVIAEQCLEIADEAPDTFSTEHGERVDPGDVAHKKLKIDTRLKLLAIWNPKKYGPKLDVTTKDQPITQPIDDVAASVASLLATAQARKEKGGGDA